MPDTELHRIAVLIAGLFLGGLLKGVTGAGLPIIAVPLIAAVFDIRFAVVLLAVPNFFTNLWQILQYRRFVPPDNFWIRYALAGAVGAAAGTALLAYLPVSALSLIAVVVVASYVLLRVFNPNYQVSLATAQKWVYPVGIFAGSLQGAIGLSSPVSLSFLHARRLSRETFVFTASVFFALLSVLQVPAQIILGVSSLKFAVTSTLALFPITLGLWIGDYFGKRLNQRSFDNTILILLVLVSLKMIYDIVSA